MEILVFSHEKAPLFKTLLVLGQKKGAFSIPDIHKSIEAKGAILGAFFRFFIKCDFSRNNGAFFSNKARASILWTKGAFFLKSMDLQLSLEKKIKCVTILVIFLQ